MILLLAHQGTSWPEAIVAIASIMMVPAILYVILKYL